ncbi:MAG: GNAT family N-acetyltransferase [Actinomycetota bacterium]|nr:GNAT family N-acetyltransferase [Actinomycetota bacterium]MDH5224405.1 GNAT family N-acetyltransferase [Actinomycetota bacterium]MDH5312912.1 GNAT family N-acetyltransferase [Actinomycetota bacterium]
MRFRIRSFTALDADDVAGWRYPAPYDAYDATEDSSMDDEMRDPRRWGESWFAADDAQTGRLAGFLEFAVIRTEDVAEVKIGLGLRPDLTGHGVGTSFVEEALAFARSRWAPESFALDVFPWNERAIRCYERAGFVRGEVYVRRFDDGNEVRFLRMARPA